MRPRFLIALALAVVGFCAPQTAQAQPQPQTLQVVPVNQTGVECLRESEVVNAVLTGAWPYRADERLVAHAVDCDVCREVASIAVLLCDDGERARHEVRVPAAGQVWWRAAVRARLDSAHAAARPITWMHAIAGAVFLGLILAVLTMAWPMVAPTADRLWMIAASFFPTPEAASAVADSLRHSLLLGPIAAAFLVLAPLAVFFVLYDE